VVPTVIDNAAFFKCIKRDRVTQVLTSTAQAWNLLQYAKKHDPRETEDTRHLRYFAVGGSAMSHPLQAELRSRICANLFSNYGSTEGGLLARAGPELLQHQPDTAGYLMPWVEAQALDENGAVLSPGSTGILRFRIPAAASGYEGDPEATARVFRDGWYYPGDTGSVDARGILKIGAREDDIINVGGTKVDPTVIEAVLNADPSVRESVVIGTVTEAGAPVLIGVVVARHPIDANALRATCRDRLGAQRAPAAIVTIPHLPRNAEGKVLRREVTRVVRAHLKSGNNSGDVSGEG
jgi:acyl-coenzyme A synthetase/AMP-(fatty) acid ligase